MAESRTDRGYLSLGGRARLHFECAGSGQPIVFVPGWTCSLEFFDRQLPLARSFQVIRFDPRGQGSSSKPFEGHSFRDRARDLAQLISSLQLSSVVLVGWSYGSYDVWAYLRQYGFDKVDRVVIVDQPPKSLFDPKDAISWGEVELSDDSGSNSRVYSILRGVIDDRVEFWSSYVKYMLGAGYDHGEDLIRFTRLGMKTPQRIAVATLADGISSDFTLTAQEAASRCPTLFFVREDWLSRASAWLRSSLPHAVIQPMPVHMGFWTECEMFNARLAAFVG